MRGREERTVRCIRSLTNGHIQSSKSFSRCLLEVTWRAVAHIRCWSNESDHLLEGSGTRAIGCWSGASGRHVGAPDLNLNVGRICSTIGIEWSSFEARTCGRMLAIRHRVVHVWLIWSVRPVTPSCALWWAQWLYFVGLLFKLHGWLLLSLLAIFIDIAT
jgi:hypothetical protein